MYQYPDYLMHYGVPGMKWGVRKQRTYDTSTAYGRMKTAKQQYKSDKKAYNKSFNKAYYHNHAYSLSKKKRQASADRWNDAIDKARSLNSSKKAYKSAKKEYKNSMSEADKKARRRRNAKIAAGVAGVALAAYGAHKIYTGSLNNRAAEKAEQLLKDNAKMKVYEALAKENWTKYGRNFVYDMGDAIISGNKYGYGVVRK